MPTRTNAHGQPIGPETGFTSARPPAPVTLTGRGIRLEPLTVEHAADLFAATGGADRAHLWTYRSDEQPADVAEFERRIEAWDGNADTVDFALVPLETGRAAGMCTLQRADVAHGCVEVASILYGPQLQRSRAATEAMGLLMDHVFTDLGMRRYEWKCDALNVASREAAIRLGFIWEGRFRQHMVYKGRNRNTDWFSITDAEYPRVRKALDDWLDDRNFNAEGRQRVRLLARPATA